jgi:hypothetical protein
LIKLIADRKNKEDLNYGSKCCNSGITHVSTDEEVIRIVDEVIDYIKSTGVKYYVGPCETAIEGL